MLKILGLCISCLVLGITVGLPTKDIDELIYRLEELKQQNHYVGSGRRPRTTEQNNNSILNGKPLASHHTVDLEEKPLLFEYYSNTLNPIIDRRNFDEVDNHLGKRSIDTEPDRYPPKRFFLERPRALPTVQEQQQKQHNFHEVSDKNDYQEYMKRMLNDDRIVPVKRNFDEIDRFGLNRFVQTPYHSLWNKRNFDEIDRLVPQIFTDNKREDGNNDVPRSGKYVKYV
ncbi:uncharacterized protein LOC129575291 isoform X2 [Sitodiplosis mosellana]|uniref:uncharacterized protein LOC129575291 isoform X2 n=1 Tax=Sitodiplosis mosellana TaxID=263140 RepID=UPI002443A740|nr:uncharacterized protein LOC129575291 isoform X2 [Sitodiplosis mosellana]XP_055314551.1 uncharacterized protein LOC129575291 isoform X2 [Sitodiplosis mosellana]XP_055314552.1 uncharacterized protein LOC129575291 isoform X2 [Sitodiplosis mosellana]